MNARYGRQSNLAPETACIKVDSEISSEFVLDEAPDETKSYTEIVRTCDGRSAPLRPVEDHALRVAPPFDLHDSVS